MSLRRQLPVHSPVRASHLMRAAVEAVVAGDAPAAALEALVADRFGARRVIVTDSGTSALVLALRVAVGANGTVALPGFACIDLTAAALKAGVGVRLYDLDPATLAPDLDSLERVLREGVDAIVIAHLYGMPVDARPIRRMAGEYGATVIDDAAQGAGARFDGKLLGSAGELGVLSFGRGKGITGGRGGALLVMDPLLLERAALVRATFPAALTGAAELGTAAAQWTLGRPSTYALPAMLPWLRLGEMVYHPAGEPRAMARGAAALASLALADSDAELRVRCRHAQQLRDVLAGVDTARSITPALGSEPGYLRFPVVDRGGRSEQPEAGILRSYPRAMHEQIELRPAIRGETLLPGASDLTRSLFTLPTHSLLSAADVDRLATWVRASPA